MEREDLGNAHGIEIVSDERGFELHFETDQGAYVMNIHGCSLDLLHAVDKELRPYWQKAEDARRTYIPPAGGMTPEEIRDVYRDHPGKREAMLGELDKVNRPW